MRNVAAAVIDLPARNSHKDQLSRHSKSQPVSHDVL